MDLIRPKEITVTDGDGADHTVIISKFPAVQGLEIKSCYPASMIMSSILPKYSDYKITQDLMMKIMGYVAFKTETNPIRLTTIELVNNHAGDWEALVKIIWAIMEYNNSFFRNGTISSFFADIVRIVQAKILEISTQSSAQSSQTEKPPFMN